MPRNGSGTYSLPSGNPVVTGTTISSTTHNNTMSDVASELTASLAKDGQTTPTANLPMGGYKHTNVADSSARTDYAKVSQVQDGTYLRLASVSGTDTITATVSPAISAYASGQRFSFISAGANTGAATININSLGAKSITKEGTTALAAADIVSGAIVHIEYDGTQFQLVAGRSIASYQPLDATLTALAGLATGVNKVPYSTGTDTFGQLDFKDEDDMASDSATAVPSQQSVKAYVDTSISGISNGPTLATMQASTSGTSIDFTSIPAGTKEIIVMLSGVSTNGTSIPIVQIGDSGGVETSGYSGSVGLNSSASVNFSAGFRLVTAGASAASLHGAVSIRLMDSSTNLWAATILIGRSDTTASYNGGGSKALSATLDRVRVTAENGTDAFDSGNINIQYI